MINIKHSNGTTITSPFVAAPVVLARAFNDRTGRYETITPYYYSLRVIKKTQHTFQAAFVYGSAGTFPEN